VLDRRQKTDGRHSDLRIGIMRQRFEHGIANSEVLSDKALKTLKSLQANARILVVAEGDQKRPANAFAVFPRRALMTRLALAGEQLYRVGANTFSRGRGSLHQKIANILGVERAFDRLRDDAVVMDLHKVCVRSTLDTGHTRDHALGGVGV